MNLRRPTIYGAGTSGGSGRPITGGAIASGRLSHFEPVSIPRLKRPLASSIWNRNGYSNVWWTRRNSSSSSNNNHNSKSKTGNRVSAAKASAPIPTQQQQQRSKSITPKSADQRKIHFFDETILQNDDYNQDNNRPKSSPPLPNNNNNNNNSEQKQKLKQRQQQTLNIARKPSAIYHYNSFQFLNSLRNFRSPSPSGGEPPVRASSTTTTSIVYHHQHHHQQQHLRHHQTELARHYKMSKDILNNFVRLKATQIDDLFGGGGRRSQPDQSYFERQDSDNDNRGKYDESQIMGDGGDEEPEMVGERNEEETDLPITENQLAESPQPPNGNINDNISAGSGGGISPKSPKSTSMIFEPHSSQQSQQQKIEMMKEEIEPRNEHKKAINRPKSSTTTTNPVLRHKQQHQQHSSGGGGSIGRSGKSSTGNIRPKSASNLLSNRRNALITNQRSQDSATQQHQVDNEHPPALSSPSTLEAGFLHRSLDRISSIANWERQIRYELEIEKELQRRELDRQKAKLQSDQRKLDEWDKQLRIELDARERKIRLAEDELRARHEECAANSAALLRREHTIDEIVAERIKAEMRVEIDKLRKKFNELEVDKCNLSKKEERVKEVEARLHEQVKIVKEKIDSKRMTDIEMAKFKKELEIIKKENEVLKEKVDSMEDYQVTKFENRAMKSELQILRDALDAKTQELERERERWEREQRAYDQKVISLRGDLRKAEQELQLQKQKEQCDIDEHNSRYEAVSAQLKRLQAFVKDHLAKLNSDFSSTTQSLSLLGGVSKRASPRHHASSHHLNRRLNRSIGGSSSGGGGAQLGLNRNYHHQRSISMDGHDYMSTHASQQRSRNRDHSDQQQQQQQQPHHSSGLKNWNISSSFHHHHHHHRQRSPRGCLLCDDDDDDDDDVYDVDIYDDDKHVCENDEKGVCDHIERVNGDELHVPIIVEDEYSLAEIDERDSILEHDGGGGGGEEGKSIENGNSADLMVLRNQNQNFRNEKIAKQKRELTAVTVANEDEHLAASREQKIANKIYEKITNQNQNRISLSSGDHEAKHHHQRNNSSSNNNNSQNNNNNSNNGDSPIIEGNLLMSRLLSSMTMATQDTKMNSNNKIANNQINNFDQTTKSVSSLYAEERKPATNRTSSDDGGGSGSLIKSIRKLDLNNYEHEIEDHRHYNNGRTEANRKSKMTTHADEDDEDDSPKSLYDELLQATGVGKIDSKSYLAAAAAPPPQQQQQQRLTITTHNDDNNNHVVSAKTDTMTTSSVGIATTTATTTTTTTIIVDSSSPKISIVERDAAPSLGAKSPIVPKQVNIVDADNRRKSASSSSSSSSRHNSQNGDSKSDSFEIDW